MTFGERVERRSDVWPAIMILSPGARNQRYAVVGPE